MKIESPTGALTVTVHERPAPAAVQFGEFAATLAITGAATPVTAIETDAVDGDERGAAIADQRVDQHLPGPGIVPIARRFPRRCIIVVAPQTGPHPGCYGRIVPVEGP